MVNLKKETYQLLLFLISLSALLFAFAVQYLLGYQPCNLCLIERIPYALALIILLLNYKFKKDQNFYSVLLILIFLFSLLISIYHFGIEQGLIDETSICSQNNTELLMNKEKILESLKKITINCKDVSFRIFELSLTSYNIIISLIMILMSIQIYLLNQNEARK